jgi:hypothetical protein
MSSISNHHINLRIKSDDQQSRYSENHVSNFQISLNRDYIIDPKRAYYMNLNSISIPTHLLTEQMPTHMHFGYDMVMPVDIKPDTKAALLAKITKFETLTRVSNSTEPVCYILNGSYKEPITFSSVIKMEDGQVNIDQCRYRIDTESIVNTIKKMIKNSRLVTCVTFTEGDNISKKMKYSERVYYQVLEFNLGDGQAFAKKLKRGEDVKYCEFKNSSKFQINLNFPSYIFEALGIIPQRGSNIGSLSLPRQSEVVAIAPMCDTISIPINLSHICLECSICDPNNIDGQDRRILRTIPISFKKNVCEEYLHHEFGSKEWVHLDRSGDIKNISFQLTKLSGGPIEPNSTNLKLPLILCTEIAGESPD